MGRKTKEQIAEEEAKKKALRKALKGLQAAVKNRTEHRVPPHDPRIMDNKICLISHCQSPVYHDGEIYWSLCLSCLQELQLGPFSRSHEPASEGWPNRGACGGSVVAEGLFLHQGGKPK